MAALLRSGVRIGFFAGLLAWHFSLVGMVESFAKRRLFGLRGGAASEGGLGDLLTGLDSLGYFLLLALMFAAGAIAARRAATRASLGAGAVAGATVGLMLSLLAFVIENVNLRSIFIKATPALTKLLTFERGAEDALGLLGMPVLGAVAGLLGAALLYLRPLWRRAIVTAVLVTALVAVLRDVLKPLVAKVDWLSDFLFSGTGLNALAALAIFVLTIAVIWARSALHMPRLVDDRAMGTRDKYRPGRIVSLLVLAAVLLSVPRWAGPFLSNVADLVGLYVMMGLGLNLVVGFAGLLDLGFVAFFAMGAYTMAILTSPEIASYHWGFWQALPVSMLTAMLAGVALGLPVLRMRGDYLAIATLGFGEIIRILLRSNWLQPQLGGAQGITLIDQPEIGGYAIKDAQSFYYLILAGCLVAWFLSVRLKKSRQGRAWLAIREDEDVAQAMGINRVSSKLLAFSIAAMLGGLAGAIFAAMLRSVAPGSFELLVSINVLALIIIGGMGSLPGVVIGALALVGLPELLREFRDYRLLVYGMVLVAMMLFRPEGLWPEATVVRQMHDAEETGAEDGVTGDKAGGAAATA